MGCDILFNKNVARLCAALSGIMLALVGNLVRRTAYYILRVMLL